MLAYVVRRLLISVPLVLASSFLVFLLVAGGGGDPLENMRVNPRISEEQIRLREIELKLDEPLIERYGLWLGDAVQGDFGTDNNGAPVAPQLWRALRLTLRLLVVSIALAVVLAVIVGAVSALRQYSLLDHSATFVAFLFFSLPIFWLAALLKEFLAIRLNDFLGGTWVYTVGAQSPNLSGGFWTRAADIAGHMVLPALTIVIVSFAQYSRYVRSSMLDVLNSDYVRTARAKGLPARRVVTRHALRNALIPLTTVVALDFGALVGGAIVTEQVFNWNGMGKLILDGVRDLDIYVVQAWLLVTATVVILFNLVADVLYAWLDPRIRYD